MNLVMAYTAAWKDLKSFATKAETFIVKQAPVIEKVTQEAGAAVAIVDPALAPIVTQFDALEEAAMGKLAALASDTANASTLSGLFGADWPVIQGLVSQLSTHPAVIAAK